MQPNNFRSLGNGYYSDGSLHYFCASIAERNTDQNMVTEILEQVLYSLFNGKRPQDYIYPYKRMEAQKPLKALEGFSFMATDGEALYYKGELVDGADIATLQKIGGSTSYFFDKKHVYYEGKALSLSNREKLKLVAREQGEPFLYDAEEGKVFIGAFMFDKEKGPYKVLGKGGNHLYHLLLNQGVIFTMTKQRNRSE